MADYTFTLPETLTLETVEHCTEKLCGLAFAKGETCILDASSTQSMGMVGVQLLLSLYRTLESLGVMLVLKGAGESIERAFHDLGCGTQWRTLTSPSS
jgi:anti-anti-sigma regulatory factor